MTEDEDRHADEVNIAFQMGAEWQKKRSDSAWKGIHEGAVLALQERIKELETELANTFKNFMQEGLRAEKLEAALKKAAERLDEIGQNDDAANAYAALEGKKDE